MPFPAVFSDHTDQTPLLRINPDASLTVLNWSRVIDLSCQDQPMDRFNAAICQVLRAARHNFIELSLEESDRAGEQYSGLQIVNSLNMGCKIQDEHGDVLIELNDSGKWTVNWKGAREVFWRYPVVDASSAAYVGLVRLFLAAQDNFLTE